MSSKVQKIFIPCNTPSSKNSKVWTGKFLVSSKATQKYTKETKQHWIANKELFIKMLANKSAPYNVHLYFVRQDKRKFDYNNISQIVFDLMQDYGWIEDDSAYMVTPIFDGFEVDKDNPGVFIHVK